MALPRTKVAAGLTTLAARSALRATGVARKRDADIVMACLLRETRNQVNWLGLKVQEKDN